MTINENYRPIVDGSIFILKINNVFWVLCNIKKFGIPQIVNRKQRLLLKKFDGKNTIKDIAKNGKIPIDDLLLFCKTLIENRILKLEEDFILPNPENVGLNFWIHTTNECNLFCGYCYIKTCHQNQSMDEETIDKFFLVLHHTVLRNGIKNVTLRLSGGEPLLRFKLWKDKLEQLSCDLAKIQCKLHVAFLTNLAYMPTDLVPFLKSHNYSISVSLDGLSHFNDKNRHFKNGEGAFTYTFHNLETLKENGIDPLIMITISNDNILGLKSFVKMLVAKHYRFNFSLVQNVELNHRLVKNKLNKVYDFLERQTKRGYKFTEMHSFDGMRFGRYGRQYCGSGINAAGVYTNGDIFFCQQKFGSDEAIGSVNTSDLDLVEVIQKQHNFHLDLSSECKQCNYFNLCHGGCPFDRNTDTGISSQCDFIKMIIPRILKIEALERLKLLCYECD